MSDKNLAVAYALKKRKKMAHGGEMKDYPSEECEGDLVKRAMKKHAKGYSEGGMVANDDDIEAGFEPAEFDDLVKRDDLESSYIGANSGDEVGNSQEDDDRHDIVARAKRSWAKKDRNPRPA